MSTVVAAMLVWLALGIPATPAAAQRQPIQSFLYLSDFSAATRVSQTITFDEFTTGTTFGNPASFGPVNVQHSTAATFKTEADAFVPVSSPNVLAPFQSDGTLVFGNTTLTFGDRTRAVGMFLVIPRGSNQTASWTSTVTATDIQNHSLTAYVIFQGELGEQRFIGFKSRLQLASITFTPATKSDATSVVALDNIMVD